MTYQPGSLIHAVALSTTLDGDDEWHTYTLGAIKSDIGATSLVFETDADDPTLAKLFTGDTVAARLKTDRRYASRVVDLAQRSQELFRAFPEVAWPTEIVFEVPGSDNVSHDKLHGIIMPELDRACSLFDLMHEEGACHGFETHHALSLARSLASLLQRLHDEHWHFVVGDLSPHNVFIAHTYKTVHLIDTDTWSFTVDGGQTFYDTPGLSPGYRSPVSFTLPDGAPMPAEHDDYVLAILIFQLFMLAEGLPRKHPLTPLEGEEDDNIRAARFPFADAYRADEVHDDLAAVYLRWDEPIRRAFERTFAGAPLTAGAWADLLADYRRSLLSP